MSEQEQPTEKILTKIRKLLAVANGNAEGGEHERDTAMKMALRMLTKYNLDMAQFANQADREDRKAVQETFYAYPWMRWVANAVAELYFCKFYSSTIPQYKRIYTFVGLESNANAALDMTRWIIKSIQKEALAERRRRGEGEPFENSFLNAAGKRVAWRCDEMKVQGIKEQEQEKTPGTALVLANFYDTEAQANARHIEVVLNVKFAKPKKSTARESHAIGKLAGDRYGQQINLSRQIGKD